MALSAAHLLPTARFPSIKRKFLPAAAAPCSCIPLHVQCNAKQQVDRPAAVVERRSAHYQPSIWSPDLIESFKHDRQLENLSRERVKKLEEKVRRMINEEQVKPKALLELVDCIQRLGLGHRFEKEIRRVLDKMASEEEFDAEVIRKSLHHTALRFRLLRQHGYQVTQDVFKVFTDDSDKFPATLSGDIEGLLNLYEASYLGFDGEHLLDDAKGFTREHLRNFLLSHSSIGEATIISEQVSHALELPMHKRMERLEARWNIELYQEMKFANPILLELSKLDFDMVQSTYRRELQDMSRWWKEMGLANRLHFARDRLMECFFWTIGMTYEPHLSDCRKELTKVTSFITVLDDVYDVYGSLDELELFTEAVQRWDTNAVKDLPDYMKLCFLALYNTVNEMAYAVLKESGQNIIPILTKVWADLCKTFLVEAKWNYYKQTPSFNDYFENAWQSVSGIVILIHSYFLTSPEVTPEAITCLDNYHDLLRYPSIIFRLCNDLGTSKAELERGENVSSILCYMKENGGLEEDARRHMSRMIDESWMKLNRAKSMGLPFPEHFIRMCLNLARISQCTYQHGDGHGAPDTQSRNKVSLVILEPIYEYLEDLFSISESKDNV